MTDAGLADGQLAAPRPQLRLAAAFTGGVSLAVWMGGMAREMNLLLAASRIRRGETVADTTEPGRRVRAGYAALLDLLDVNVSMDVLSGTSAGGINAAILGLANVQRFDLDGLRELWFAEGSLGGLLRNPADKTAPSLLYGDQSLLAGLRAGLQKLAASAPSNPAAAQDPTRVFLTTTLLAGEPSRFTDEYGTLVRDIDHHGLFSFTSAELTPGNVPALALAARCSASFPVAFEPGLIPIGAAGGDGHPDMAAFSNTQATQFAADGGLLMNRPLGPALQAVFDRPADSQVRRVLAFVVPQTGGPTVATPKLSLADTPDLPGALAADVTALTTQTISADLAGIAAHNQQVRSRNDARQQLAVLGSQMDRLGAPFYRSYREQRAGRIAQTTANEVLTRATAGHRAADGRPAGFGADAERARQAASTAVLAVLPAALPPVGDYGAMNAAGREALDDGRATVLGVLSRAYQLAAGRRPAHPGPAPAVGQPGHATAARAGPAGHGGPRARRPAARGRRGRRGGRRRPDSRGGAGAGRREHGRQRFRAAMAGSGRGAARPAQPAARPGPGGRRRGQPGGRLRGRPAPLPDRPGGRRLGGHGGRPAVRPACGAVRHAARRSGGRPGPGTDPDELGHPDQPGSADPGRGEAHRLAAAPLRRLLQGVLAGQRLDVGAARRGRLAGAHAARPAPPARPGQHGQRPGQFPRRAAGQAGADRRLPGASWRVDPVPGPARPPAGPG